MHVPRAPFPPAAAGTVPRPYEPDWREQLHKAATVHSLDIICAIRLRQGGNAFKHPAGEAIPRQVLDGLRIGLVLGPCGGRNGGVTLPGTTRSRARRRPTPSSTNCVAEIRGRHKLPQELARRLRVFPLGHAERRADGTKQVRTAVSPAMRDALPPPAPRAAVPSPPDARPVHEPGLDPEVGPGLAVPFASGESFFHAHRERRLEDFRPRWVCPVANQLPRYPAKLGLPDRLQGHSTPNACSTFCSMPWIRRRVTLSFSGSSPSLI